MGWHHGWFLSTDSWCVFGCQTLITDSEELEIAYIKVDTHYHVKKWNQLFLDIVDITKSELIYERLNTLADQFFLMDSLYDLLNQSLQSKRVEVNHYEDKETILHLRALPKPKNLSINLFTSLVYASNSIIISM